MEINNNIMNLAKAKELYNVKADIMEKFMDKCYQNLCCKLHVTEHVLESIAFRIGEIFREHGFYAGGHLSYSCANIEIQGWGKDFDK